MLTPVAGLPMVVSLVFSLVEPSRIVGRLPSGFSETARVAWVSSDPDRGDVRCGLAPGGEWSCENIIEGMRGLVVLVGDGMVSAVAVGLPTIDPAPTEWGRVVRITTGGVSPEDLHDITMESFKPDRPRTRLQTRRFAAITNDDVRVWKLTDMTFWVAGGETDRNAFIVIDGPAVGGQRVATRQLREGAPDEPFYLPATAPASLTGLASGAHGVVADGADIELWELLQPNPQPSRLDDSTPVIRRAAVSASADGMFRFDRVSGGVALISGRHPALGTGRVWITEPGPTIDLELTLPPRATGRVVKHSLPVAGALVRFLPDADAFVASTDPMDHVSRDVRTADDGTFSVPLPAKRAGALLVALDDGTRARVAVPTAEIKGDVVLGDITVPDDAHLTVRLLDGSACVVVAIGPLGPLGLAIVRAESVTLVYELDLPEAGAWSLNAKCNDHNYELDPPIVVVPPDGKPMVVDARVRKSPG